MADYNAIPTGLIVPTQIPLDVKSHVSTIAELIDLGANNFKAFMYYKGLKVFCIENNNTYVWKESAGLTGGLLTNDFTYPDGIVCFGVDYSLKAYNFFLKTESLEIFSVGYGAPVYKGFNDVTNQHEIKSIVVPTDGNLEMQENEKELIFRFKNIQLIDTESEEITLSEEHNLYTIFIVNEIPRIIFIPNNLPNGFIVSIFQISQSSVKFYPKIPLDPLELTVELLYPAGLAPQIKGKGYCVVVEKMNDGVVLLSGGLLNL